MIETAHAPGTMVLLTRLAKAVYRRSNEAVLGMRLKQFVALAHLRDHGEVSQQALGEALGLDANNLVLLLNELEGAGHVERHRDPTDRRRHIVSLTTAGQRALERGEKGMDGVQDEVLAALTAEQRATLHTLLSRALGGS
ncbi:MAG: MarR family winged helix-turn-helix transcriptional regulator [Conexibacter sp.]